MSFALAQAPVVNNVGLGSGSISVSFASVTAGDLIPIAFGYGYASGNGTTFTFSDNHGSVYTIDGSSQYAAGFHGYTVLAHTIVQTTGAYTITCTLGGASSAGALAMCAVDLSFAAGMTIAVGTLAHSYASSTTPTSTNVSWSGSGNFALWGAVSANGPLGTITPGTGFTGAANISGTYISLGAEYQLNLAAASSPIACTFSDSTSNFWICNGVTYHEVLAVSPQWSVTRDRTDSRRVMWAE